MEYVILVNENDKEIGIEEKIKAHQKGLLHRAFSILIFNPHNEVILQRRSLMKYHSKGLLASTCDGHPRPGEPLLDAVVRRLKEETNLECHLAERFSFIYRADVGDGLIEHEYDHVMIGYTDQQPTVKIKEASEYTPISIPKLKMSMAENPSDYSIWLRMIIDRI